MTSGPVFEREIIYSSLSENCPSSNLVNDSTPPSLIPSLPLQVRSLQCVRVILEHGADVDLRDVTGYTALHWALYSHKMTTAKSLMLGGADTMAVSQTGWTPLTVCLYW